MKFYNRLPEKELLQLIQKRSLTESQMTIVTGRRRIGKTTLIRNAFENHPMVYLFVARKNEVLLCQEFVEIIMTSLKTEMHGEFRSFNQIFAFLMELSAREPFTLIIDEFQEFLNINPSVFSEMQNTWDQKKSKSNLNLLLCGSVYSLMQKLFLNAREPLFGRANNRLHIKPFSTYTIKEILEDNHPGYTKDDLLSVYMLTGGIPRYLELLVSAKAFTINSILGEVFSLNSFYLEEGKNLLIDEFGKDYGNYFSILSLIASSKTSRQEIESILGISTGGYLDRLENEFSIISKSRPVLAKPGTRSLKYRIDDPFLRFWFRYIYRNKSTIETGNLAYVRDIVQKDYENFCGKALESWFIQKLTEEQTYSIIGTYWEKKNQNEIDIVAINDIDQTVIIAEIKRNPKKINLKTLQSKAAGLVSQLPGYSIIYKGYSLIDM
ncbi:MAG: ATP-binding protein [Bacteroidales bacterium]